ncbi:hypothetical protein [Anatilimnocola floriformis]|uniref:hypothetical protein n=1 Tax=Anatilimnocola floriformis TaxID=2948575 RepID=UPI0020C4F9F7|nr:hypothetical protein [Anatilimnocola floriformis]
MVRQFLSLLCMSMIACSAEPELMGAESEWLAKHVPPAFNGGTPFTLKAVNVSRNHVDQEIIQANYERTPEIIRTLAKEIKLVILPVGGGHFEAGANAGIAASPAQSGTINGITDSLLDYRGKIPGGARAYVEMTVANAVKAQPPVRISNIFWIGSAAELQAAQKKELVDPRNSELRAVVTKTVAENANVAAGTPVRFSGGTHWFKGTVAEKSNEGEPLKLIVYFARPGGLYLPWYVTADRSDVKVENAALDAAKTDATWFADHLREVKGRIGQGNAPHTLKSAGEKVSKGDRVVWFGFHGLMGGEALEDPQNGKVKVRDTRFMQEAELETKQLFVDPEPSPK